MKKIFFTIIIIFTFLLPVTANAHHFPDLPKNHWAYHSIHNLSEANILNGYSNGDFKPAQDVNRGQAAIILAKSLNLNLNTSFEPEFQDLPTDHYAYKQIAALTEMGVFANVSTFNPAEPLTRSQMAKIIIEGFNVTVDDNDQVAFNDVPDAHWASDYINTIAEIGVSFGVTPVVFDPEEYVTRAQLAAFVDRAMLFDSRLKSKVITYDTERELYTRIDSQAGNTIEMVNQKRVSGGLEPLKEDPALSKIAQLKAEDMVNNKYFAHVSPIYGKPWEMALHFGYPTNQVGENIASGFSAPDEVMTAWMNSTGHKENILRESYTVIGIGYMEDEEGIPHWVHMFAIN